MSTAAIPGPPSHSLQEPSGRLLAFEDYTPTIAAPVKPVFTRRRGSLVQGRALESLGHAVEYLMDCGMFRPDLYENEPNQEAIRILMRCSRHLFEECPEVIPMGRRLSLWSRRIVAKALRRRPLSSC